MALWGIIPSISDTKKFLFGDNEQRNKALDEKNFQLQGGDMLRNYAQQQMQGAQGRTAPTAQAAQLGQASQLDAAQQAQVRAREMALADQMQGVASGQQMGAGEMATRRQADQQAAQIAGQTAMSRGANAGIMARAAARSLGDLGVNAAGQAAQSALQDQSAARGQLAGLLGQSRSADLSLAGQNAQLAQQRMLQQGSFDQQTALANQAAMLQQRGQNDAYGLGMMGGYLNTSEAELRARLARAGMYGEDKGMFGDLLQAGGSFLAGK